MLRLTPAALVLALAQPAAADEFTDTLESALEAYRSGDVSAAREDLDFAGKLLAAMKSEALAKFLPAAPGGWTRGEASDEEAAAGGMMGMFGGGTSAAATYTKGAEQVTVTLVADSPMVSGLGAMISGMAGLAGGKPLRIQRTEFTEQDGDLQGVVNGRVMVSVTGGASVEDKRAFLEAMDFGALGNF
ncbi:hypothetical protein [Amaricoccus sp.]|mgnify:CR=1 FL=1|uniref:hypothetical protein n=1 Tax=Amaricoccus sp. TaxID=1872485 RepID=UPI00260C31B3|nr:hypothetical protein [Amaricoccus sp.]HRO12861.1 hypothetical protein [Amaricoccus sp.]